MSQHHVISVCSVPQVKKPLDEISVSQLEFGDQELTIEDPALRYSYCSSDVKRVCVICVEFGSPKVKGRNRPSVP